MECSIYALEQFINGTDEMCQWVRQKRRTEMSEVEPTMLDLKILLMQERIARIEAQSVLMNNDYQAAKAELEKFLKEKEGAK